MTPYQYQVGGSLPIESPTYIKRQADDELYQGLKTGDYCYVLNSRQMGKSSLRVHTMQRLQADGIACGAIDLTRIGSQQVTLKQWYAGIIRSLWSSFELTETLNIRNWLRDLDYLSSVQQLSEFIDKILLGQIHQDIIIFVDEIDSAIGLSFPVDDFFELIRACYNHRADTIAYRRLSFALFGVASPSDLIQDRNVSTPFNIGRAIELTGFQWHETTPLYRGLEHIVSRLDTVLAEVLDWTGGQPLLTQRLCKLIQHSDEFIAKGDETEAIENLVRSHVIENWTAQDEPEHLKTIRDRLLLSKHTEQLLKIYQNILQQGEIEFHHTPLHFELRLTGLVVHQNGKLKVYNRIYAEIFDLAWVNQALEAIPRTQTDTQPAPEIAATPAISTPTPAVSLSPEIEASQDDSPLSECGIDYTQLEKLLANQQWQDADLETRKLMLQAVNRLEVGWFRAEDLQNFPRTDLLAIDRLWNQASNGRFGFQVQARIWQEIQHCGGSNYTWKSSFADRLQWRSGGVSKPYPMLNFTLEAPEGHLPVAWTGLSVGKSPMMGLGIFFDRVQACHQTPNHPSNIAADVVIPQKIDYTRLCQLLNGGQWQDADLETQRILLKLVDRSTANPFRLEDLGSLSGGDLHVLDRLWSESSHGNFGYSIQQQLWQNLAPQRSMSQRLEQFVQQIGWHDGRHLRAWHRLIFSLKAPAGHLPSLVAPTASNVSLRLLLCYFLAHWEQCQERQRQAVTAISQYPNFAGGIHCTPLKHFLVNRQWQSAEAQTAELLLQIAGCQAAEQLSTETIDRLSCEALCAIDRLWVRAIQSHAWMALSFRHLPRHLLGTVLPALSSKLARCYGSDDSVI